MPWCIRNTAICRAFFSFLKSPWLCDRLHLLRFRWPFVLYNDEFNKFRQWFLPHAILSGFPFLSWNFSISALRWRKAWNFCTQVKESFSMLEFTDHKRSGSCLFFVRAWSTTNWIKRFWRKTFINKLLGAAAIGQQIVKETTHHSFGCRILRPYGKSMEEHRCLCIKMREI